MRLGGCRFSGRSFELVMEVIESLLNISRHNFTLILWLGLVALIGLNLNKVYFEMDAIFNLTFKRREFPIHHMLCRDRFTFAIHDGVFRA